MPRLLRSQAAAHAEDWATRVAALEARLVTMQEQMDAMPVVRMLDPSATQALFDRVMLRFALTLVAGVSASLFLYTRFIR